MSGAGAPVRVLSYNIRYDTEEEDPGDNWSGQRRNAVVAFLRWVGADIVGLQEVLPKQLDFLSNALAPEYAFVGIGREADGGGEASPIFYRKARFGKAKFETHWLSETPDKPGSMYPGAGCTRLVTCARLTQSGGGGDMNVFCTHLDHHLVSNRNDIQRDQAKILLGLVDAFSGGSQELPRVIMGDFNSTACCGAPPTLEHAGYTDTSEGDKNSTFINFDDRTAGAGVRGHIDWIFIRGLSYEGYTIYNAKYRHIDGKVRNASDHTAVGVRLMPQNGGGAGPGGSGLSAVRAMRSSS